jgi:hypothetical protein
MSTRIGKRITIVEEAKALEIRIRYPRHWRVFVLLGLWTLIGALWFSFDGWLRLVLVGALVPYWAFYAIYVIRLVFGAEIVILDENLLTIRQSLFGRGKRVTAPVADVRGFEVTEQQLVSASRRFYWVHRDLLARLELTGERLAARTTGKLLRFGYQLGDEEAGSVQASLENALRKLPGRDADVAQVQG